MKLQSASLAPVDCLPLHVASGRGSREPTILSSQARTSVTARAPWYLKTWPAIQGVDCSFLRYESVTPWLWGIVPVMNRSVRPSCVPKI